MKALTKTFKSLSLAGALGAAFVLTGLTHDLGFNSSAFMNDGEVEYASRLDVQMASRDVASAESGENVQRDYWPVNDSNLGFVNGRWKVLRIYKKGGKTEYYSQKAGNSLKVDVDLVATNEIQLDGDKGLIYEISKMDQTNNKLVAKRDYQGQSEVVELKKVSGHKSEIDTTPVQIVENRESQRSEEEASPKGIMAEGYHDLTVANAIDTKWRRPNFLKGSGEIRGHLTINSGEIQELRLEVRRNTRWKDVFHTYVPIEDGGSFSVEGSVGESTSGIITNSGEGRFKIRFSTGPLAQITATFVTQDEMRKIRQKREEKERQERRAKREKREQSEDDSYSRDTDNMNKRPNDGFVPKDELTKAEKAQENVKSSNFSFKSGTPSTRKPASTQ